MKKFKVLFIPGLVAVMYLALLAQEPQGRGGQSAPAPDGGAGARGGQGPAPGGAPCSRWRGWCKGWQRRPTRSRSERRGRRRQKRPGSRWSGPPEHHANLRASVRPPGEGNVQLLPRRGPVLRRKKAEAGRPQNDHDDACNQRHLPGWPAARDLLYLPPRQHQTANGAPVLKRSGGGVARSEFGLLRGSRAGRRRFRSNSPRLSSMPASRKVSTAAALPSPFALLLG